MAVEAVVAVAVVEVEFGQESCEAKINTFQPGPISAGVEMSVHW